jgi:hypothetical protein
MLAAGLQLHHDVEPGFAVLDREAQLVEALAEHRRVVVKREEQIAEVVGPAVAILEQHGVVDDERDRIRRAEPAERVARGLDDRGRFERCALATGTQIRLAAERALELLPRAGRAQDVFGLEWRRRASSLETVPRRPKASHAA